MRTFPPLRKKILRGYLIILTILGIAGGLLVLAAVFAGTGLAPQVIHRNYDSIEASRKMQQAWIALNFPQAFPPSLSREDWVRQFEDALVFARNNITEPGEGEKTKHISEHWRSWKSSHPVSPALIQEMNGHLDELISLNEKGMFSLVERARELRMNVLIGVALFFLCCLIITTIGADTIAARLSRPLKDIAGTLRSKPRPGEKLRLPDPTSLELMILIEELKDLWARISELDQLNLQQVARQSSYLESLLASVEDAVLVFDPTGRITHVTDRMATLLGIPKSSVLHGNWQDLPTASGNYLRLRQVIIDRADKPSPVIDLQDEKGINHSFAVRFRPVTDGEHEAIATILLCHDITEIRQRDRLKSEFIGVLSHELKTPIQSLGTAAELLFKSKEQYDQRTRTLVETLLEDVSRIRAVANQFMQLGQLSNGAVRVRREDTVVSDLLPEWIKPFEILASDKKLKLSYEKQGSDRITASIDRIRFPWVVSNLLSNAIRVSPEGSKIHVLLSDQEHYTEIRVTDEGPGIPEEVQKRMFEPFYQGSSGGGAEIAGSSGFLGLGLTIVKEVTEAHDGIVEYHRMSPSGSRFRILLPISKA